MKKTNLRAKNPKTLGDLVGGDCCILDTKNGPIEVQVGFRIKGSIFVRIHDCEADQLISFDESTPFLELTYEQPGGMDRSRRTILEVDPVHGMSATDGEPILRRRNDNGR